MTASPTPRRRVSPRQIADLLTQARHLPQTGPHADPAQVADYLAAKADPLAAITDPTPDDLRADHPQEQR